MIRYHVTTHGHLPGARLSKSGHWGNVPHDSVEEAREAAHLDAQGHPYTIERKDYPALPTSYKQAHLPD